MVSEGTCKELHVSTSEVESGLGQCATVTGTTPVSTIYVRRRHLDFILQGMRRY